MSGGARPQEICKGVRDAVEELLAPALKEHRRKWERLAHAASDDGAEAIGEKEIHQIRVSSRRAAAALAVFRPVSDETDWKRVRRLLSAGRSEAGAIRDCDVHTKLLNELASRVPAERAAAVRFAVGCISDARGEAVEKLRERASDSGAARLRKRCRVLLRGIKQREDRGTAATGNFTSLVDESLAAATGKVLACAAADIGVLENMHALRLAIKRLRYTAELVREFTASGARDEAVSLMVESQTRFGEVHDIEVLIGRLRGCAERAGAAADSAGLGRELAALADGYAAVLDLRRKRAAEWWGSVGKNKLFDAMKPSVDANESAVRESDEKSMPTSGVGAAEVQIIDETISESPWGGAARNSRSGTETIEAATAGRDGRRLAVIDIGSASIRLLVVEMTGTRTWRTLAEERAMTRLAQGLALGGVIVPEALRRSVETVDRFVAVAERLGAGEVRAFATAAVRDAANGPEFVAMVRDRTGLRVRIVSEEEEGTLVFRSVARVFDLSEGASAVLDIGGGSLEVVFASFGVITGNVSMPLGAVRLTEAFGGAAESSVGRFAEMRAHIKETLAEKIRKPEQPPAIVVGCGGTFTTLLAMCAAARGHQVDRSMVGLAGLGPIAREEIEALIERLRAMPLEERLRFPGLPADRADIVVAGLTAVERLMKRLGVGHVHVHPGGIRDGLLLKMLEEKEAGAGALFADHDRMRSVREFASACRAEQPHGEQVARLALELFESMLEPGVDAHGLGTDPRERVLLEAAGVVHDVGCLVEYRSHHKHSCTMIRHADLVGWTPQAVEILALIARYHRRSDPSTEHGAFAALSGADRELVRRLAAILRVADGLDRTHGQRVSHARLRQSATEAGAAGGAGVGGVEIVVESESEPLADLAAAAEKSGLFARVFGVTPVFRWERAGAAEVVVRPVGMNGRGKPRAAKPNAESPVRSA